MDVYLWIKGEEYNIPRQGYKRLLPSCYKNRKAVLQTEVEFDLCCLVIIRVPGGVFLLSEQQLVSQP